MSFAATFNVNVTFDNPTAFAGFAADFDKLYAKFFSGAPSRQSQAAPPPAHTPQPEPPAPLTIASFRELPPNATGEDVAREFSGLISAPNPQDATATAPDAVGAPVATGDASGDTAATPDKPKRTRATKAEMEARRAAAATVTQEGQRIEPVLPKAHGGSNTGTTAPLPDLPPEPATGEFVVPNRELTLDDVKDLFARVMMLTPDPTPDVSAEVLAPLGLSRVRDVPPEKYRAACEGFVRIARSRGK